MSSCSKRFRKTFHLFTQPWAQYHNSYPGSFLQSTINTTETAHTTHHNFCDLYLVGAYLRSETALLSPIHLDPILRIGNGCYSVTCCFGSMSPGLGCTRLGWTNIAVVASLIIIHKPDIALCPASPIATDDTAAQCTYSHMLVIESITGAPLL